MRQALALIPRGKRRGAVWAVAGSVALALLDFAGIVALVSVLLLVLDSGAIAGSAILARLYAVMGFADTGSFAVAVCVAVLGVVIVKSALSLVIQNAVNGYLLSLYRGYSARMFDAYLSKGLLFIRSTHTAQLVNNVNGVCLRFTDGVLGQFLAIATQVILLLLIVVALLFFDPAIVLLAAAVFLPLALVYSLVFKRRMTENGRMENKLFVGQNKTMFETLRGYPDIEINNASRYMSEKFGHGLKLLTGYRRRAALVRGAAGRVVEMSLVLGVVAVIVVGITMGETMESLKMSLGVFAVAAYKIVPATSAIVNAWVEYKRNSFAAEKLADAFSAAPEALPAPSSDKMPFRREITLDGVGFRYQTGERDVLDGLSLSIRKGEKVGIKGQSGAGKTTLLNLICGFFEPTAGRILIDGVPLERDNVRQWQNNLAYVSQDVFIPDVTIAENVAFGVDRGDVDTSRLEMALRAASLDDFVASLPEGVDTVTGEAGCRLSGGQRQRIGIARALYKQATVLLLDEATSSLDSRTERDIVESIERLSAQRSELTMLVISHRDQTLAFCDRIIEIS